MGFSGGEEVQLGHMESAGRAGRVRRARRATALDIGWGSWGGLGGAAGAGWGEGARRRPHMRLAYSIHPLHCPATPRHSLPLPTLRAHAHTLHTPHSPCACSHTCARTRAHAHTHMHTCRVHACICGSPSNWSARVAPEAVCDVPSGVAARHQAPSVAYRAGWQAGEWGGEG